MPIIKRRWTGPESYVEVSYRPQTGEVDIRNFRRDPRKAQHHKVKYWNRGLWMPYRPVERAVQILRGSAIGRDVVTQTALRIIEEDFGLTSSDRRAAAS